MKKQWIQMCCIVIAFCAIAGFIFGLERIGIHLPQFPGTEAELTGMQGFRQAVMKVTSANITSDYRKALPRDAELDEKVFTPGRLALGFFMFKKTEPERLSIEPVTVSIPIEDLQGQISSPRFFKGNLYLETGGEVTQVGGIDFNGKPNNRSQVVKIESARLSPSKARQHLIVQSSYENENNGPVSFKSDFEIAFTGGSNSRVFVSIVQNQFGLDNKLWKRLQMDGEFAVNARSK